MGKTDIFQSWTLFFRNTGLSKFQSKKDNQKFFIGMLLWL